MSQPFVTSPSYSNIAFVVVVVVVVFPSYQLDIRGPQNLVDAARSVVPKTSSSYSVRVDDRFVASKATLELSLPMPPMPGFLRSVLDKQMPQVLGRALENDAKNEEEPSIDGFGEQEAQRLMALGLRGAET